MSAASALASDDPTGSQTLRDNFESELSRRWRTLRGNIRRELRNNQRLRPSNDRSEARQTAEFREWLEREIDQVVVEPMQMSAVLNGAHFSGEFIRRAFTHGLRLSNAHLRRAGVDVDALTQNAAEALLQEPYYQEQLQREYEGTYSDLRDKGEETHTDVSRTYRDLAAAGVGINSVLTGRTKTQDGVNNRVEKTGQTGTKRIVAYRSIRTVNEAALLQYQDAGISEVSPAIEIDATVSSGEGQSTWTTQGDSRVCPQCQSLGGSTYYISEIMQGNAPLPARDTHSHCRCFYLPVV